MPFPFRQRYIGKEQTMPEIDLQIPTIRHKAEAESFKNEFFEAQEQVINGSALLDQMDYEPC